MVYIGLDGLISFIVQLLVLQYFGGVILALRLRVLGSEYYYHSGIRKGAK